LTGRVDDWTTCPTHGKRSFWSKKMAKKAMANAHPDDSAMRAYRCDVIDGAWHYGHLPKIVRERGIVGATAFYADRAHRVATRSRIAAEVRPEQAGPRWTGWHGRQGKGAMRRRRAQKRALAQRGLT
jgi:hypothetical protein